MKRKLKPKPWVKKVVIILLIILGINTINAQLLVKSSKKAAKMHSKVANTVQKSAKVKIEIAEGVYEPPVEEQIPDIGKVIEEVTDNNVGEVAEDTNVLITYETRMTSYYPEEDTDCTGSGLCSWDFETNEYGWYTYQGKLVVATATEYLLKYGFTLYDGVHTYKYYDEIVLNIDGIDYQAIVLDSCGSSMRTDRIDLFVSGSWAVKDTIIKVKY